MRIPLNPKRLVDWIQDGSIPRWLRLLVSLLLASIGWALVLATSIPLADAFLLPEMFIAAVVALLVEFAAVHATSGDRLSLTGIVLLAATLAFGAPTGAGVALLSGLGAAVPRGLPLETRLLHRLAESGLRPLALLAALAAVQRLGTLTTPLTWGLALCLLFFGVLWGGRLLLSLATVEDRRWRFWAPEYWTNRIAVELLPLPLGFLLAAIIQALPWLYALMAAASLVMSAVLLRRASRTLHQQRQRVAELGLVNEVSRAIIRAELDVDALCDLVYEQAGKVVPTSWFHLGLFEGQNFILKVRVQDNLRLPPLITQIEQDGGIIGWMRRTGRSLLVEDFTTEMEHLPARPSYQAEHPPRSGIFIPLLAGDEVLGTISVQSPEPYKFSFDDLRLLSLVADQAAVVIAKARAYDDARRRAQQLATIGEVSRQVTAILDLDQLLPAIVRRIRSSFGYDPVHIFLTERETNELVLRASTNPESAFWLSRNKRMPIGQGIAGYVAQTGDPLLANDVSQEPRFIPDERGTKAEMAVPLRVGQDLLGVLDVQSDHGDAFDANDFFVLQTLADQIAIAIDSANLYTAQREEAWVLNALLQSAENFARASDLNQLLSMTVRLPPLLMGAEWAICLLWEREERAFRAVAAWGMALEQRAQFLNVLMPEAHVQLLAEVWRSGEPLKLAAGTAQSLNLPGWLLPLCGGSLLLLPMTARGAVLGVLLLEYCDPERRFEDQQMTIASGIAGQAASAIEGAQLATAEAERQRLEQELEVAREMQTSLLPFCCPSLPGWQISAAWRAARQVGGDFYDFWSISDDQLGFVIADVSDKGVPAALFMTLSRSLMRAAALDGSSPARAFERANRWILRDSQATMFVTIFYGLLDTSSGHLRFSNAGHNPPLLYRAANGEIVWLKTPGIALGVLEESELFSEAELMLEPGDVLVCYTDGVTEAINLTQEQFGLARLTEIVRRFASKSADEIVAAILDGTVQYTGDQPPFDDVTLVVLKRE